MANERALTYNGCQYAVMNEASSMIQFNKEDAIQQFNGKFKDGVTYCRDNFMDDTQIAQFLFENKQSLDFDQLGACLAYKDSNEILNQYMNQFNFKEMSFSMALRIMMTDFKFPGEAQQIDRVMQAFGNAYYNKNLNGELKNADAVYVLAFACVMLNTDAHNDRIRFERMTLEQFKSNTRGCNDGEDFAPEFLEKIYKDITSNEIKRLAPPKSELSMNDFEAIESSLGQDKKSEAFEEKAQLTSYERWKKGQGGYKFGYLTSYYIVDALKAKPASEEVTKASPVVKIK